MQQAFTDFESEGLVPIFVNVFRSKEGIDQYRFIIVFSQPKGI